MYREKYKKEIDILYNIAEDKGFTLEKLISSDRDKKLVKTRRIIMIILKKYILNKTKEKTNPTEIAKIVNRDRTTFLYHEKVHANEYEYEDYKEEYDTFLEKFEEKIKNI